MINRVTLLGSPDIARQDPPNRRRHAGSTVGAVGERRPTRAASGNPNVIDEREIERRAERLGLLPDPGRERLPPQSPACSDRGCFGSSGFPGRDGIGPCLLAGLPDVRRPRLHLHGFGNRHRCIDPVGGLVGGSTDRHGPYGRYPAVPGGLDPMRSAVGRRIDPCGREPRRGPQTPRRDLSGRSTQGSPACGESSGRGSRGQRGKSGSPTRSTTPPRSNRSSAKSTRGFRRGRRQAESPRSS